MNGWKLVVVVTALAGVAHAGPARAQTAADPVQRFNEGVALAGKGQWQDAVAIWNDLVGKLPDKHVPTWHLYLGMGNKELKQLPESWHHFTLYLASNPTDEQSNKDLKEVEAALLKGGYRKIAISCSPADARVAVNERATPDAPDLTYPCPLTWWFRPGPRSVRVMRTGCDTATLELNIQPGQGQGLADANLDRCFGKLIVKGERKATQVFLNGELSGKVPFERKLKPGTYQLMVGPPGEKPWKTTVEIRLGEDVVQEPDIARVVVAKPVEPVVPPVKPPVKPQADKKPTATVTQAAEGGDSGGPAWAQWTLIGSGVALLAAGGYLTYSAMSEEEDIYDKYVDLSVAENRNTNDDYDSAFDSDVAPLVTGSWILYGAGAAAALAGAAWMIWDAVQAPGGSTAMAPMLGPDVTGAFVDVRF